MATHKHLDGELVGQLKVIISVAHRDNLTMPNLRSADLSYADLSYANLSSADLSYADLSSANLSYADLRYADLSSANLSYADLRYADLRYADLSYANLSSANLSYAENNEYAAALVTIVSEGDLIGWKKCRGNVIVKLKIPAAAKRSNATGRKCRCEYAEVMEVIGATEGISQHNNTAVYRVGETVKCDKWDDNRWEECSGGIHFFITRIEAEMYQ